MGNCLSGGARAREVQQKNPLCGVPGDASAGGTRTQADAAGAADEVRQLTRLLEENTAKTKALEDEVKALRGGCGAAPVAAAAAVPMPMPMPAPAPATCDASEGADGAAEQEGCYHSAASEPLASPTCASSHGSFDPARAAVDSNSGEVSTADSRSDIGSLAPSRTPARGGKEGDAAVCPPPSCTPQADGSTSKARRFVEEEAGSEIEEAAAGGEVEEEESGALGTPAGEPCTPSPLATPDELGIPNTTRRYKEERSVPVHTTPFVARLEAKLREEDARRRSVGA
mmetsp:Transcript_54253/g.172210  ORF Transcript_54253/g.172210 Transcript_54253/m.172210 type:complete len:285 (+) Transcript_54253:393-1247(+)